MKKLLAVLLAALALIPAMVMAESNPETKIDVIEVLQAIESSKGSQSIPPYTVHLSSHSGSHGLFEIIWHDGSFSASYSPSGDLKRYNYRFSECGCQASYATNGTLIEAWHDQYEWDNVNGTWRLDGKPAALPGNLGKHTFDDSHTRPFTARTAEVDRPPLTVLEAVNAQEQFKQPNVAARSIPGNYDFASEDELWNAINPSSFKEALLVYSDGAKQLKLNSESILGYFNDGELVEAYAGAVCFNMAENEIWLQFDYDYNINTEGKYDWQSGDLELYKFYTSDRSMNAAYSLKNVMLSCEMWDAENHYWCFSDGKWYYGEDGLPPEEGKGERAPTTEVLEHLLHAPEPAIYESRCVKSAAGYDSEGVPYIISGDLEATPVITATQSDRDLRATEFDITLTEGGVDTEEVTLENPVTLTLAYPAGMTKSIVNDGNYEIVVVHEGDDGEEVMNSIDGTVKLTNNGPQVTATGFSPYTVVWGTEDELRAKYPGSIGSSASSSSLPSTGDRSNLELYVTLLALCIGGMSVLLAARKRSRA